MTSDTLANIITADTGNLYIPAEFSIFGKKSVVYNRVSEISEAKIIDNSEYLVKDEIAVSLCIYFFLILYILKDRIQAIGKMFVDYRFAKKQYKETNWTNTLNTSYTIMFTLIIASIQFSLIGNYQDYEFAMVIFMTLLGVFILQSASLKLVALICKTEDMFDEVHLNRKLYYSVSGIIVLPFTITALLYPGTEIERITFEISKIIACILYLSMIVRILRVFTDAKVSCFFRFLYLCTFEISPYLALFIVFKDIN
jgi:hypothetical protein